ncbi:PREDICTED: major facilitator superfamily domain-containing protein 6-like [Nanorana parkeri]|uniref:major facilitator superfamily domain-containing protein 6-like n=1 Tax=Nanorana parkeri TaxID=125878 RepID=UPI0008541DFA|nr:PREDICTED: major facilitator superfamily domain-containing protein 6-like [Nanorana parkeri]
MSAPKQWDISKALAVASLFNFFHSVGNFCVFPFLTIFFRHFGLSPPLVGIIMGAKHMVYALWAPFCSFVAKTNSKRRIIIFCSLLLSAVASGILTFFPPLQQGMVFRYCNVSLSLANKQTTPGALDMEMFGPEDNGSFVLPEPPKVTTMATVIITSLSNTTTIAEPAGEAQMTSKTLKKLHAAPPHHPDLTAHLRTSTTRKLSKTDASKRHTKPKDRITTSEQSTGGLERRTYSPEAVVRPSIAEEPQADGNSPIPQQPQAIFVPKKRDLSKKAAQPEHFLDGEHNIFLVVLGIVIFWEIVASPLEWTADDSVYEYLDFVDATDRHEKIWIWRYLGACLGAFSIVFLMDNVNCFFIPNFPRVYLHFYGYSAFMMITLLLSTWYPIHVSKKTEHASKTIKALGLMGSDGRIILLSITVFLMGAVRSTADNFLFWKMQDLGSSELYMGLSVVLVLVSEIVFYAFKGKLMRSLTFKWMVALGLLCQAVEFLYYSFFWAPWAVLPIQVSSAFSNGVLLWAIRSQIDDVATPGMERSIQLVLHCLSHHCGASLGSFASGFVISSFNLEILFQSCCVTLLVWLLMFLVIQPRLPQTKKINYSRLLAPDNSDMSDSEDEQERDWLVKAMKDDGKIW